MKAAIILAVSEYENTSCLPGCVLDGQLIKKLLDETAKYGEILCIDKKTSSTNVKEQLTNFIANNQDKSFDEVLFYYTGHGDFRDNDFYYVLSDFSKVNYRQTSLSNSELDNLLRQLTPNLTIKIIDACHSGVNYIKDKDVFDNHLEESKKCFSNCYFMFSSMFEQSSYQDKIISHFTKSFIDSVINHNSSEIRYKDIIDYISDEFDKNALQKPLFVTQASFTEIFCSIDTKMKTLLSGQMSNLLSIKPESDTSERLSLLDLIKRDAGRYCSEEEALKTLESLKYFIENYGHSTELASLYDISSTFDSNYKSISSYSASIGKWLKDNNNYFSKVNHKRKRPSKNTSNLYGLAASMAIFYENEPYEVVVSGFDLTVEVPFKLINIDTHPKYLNLDRHSCKIAFVLSQVSIRFFYFYSTYKLEGWDEYSHNYNSDLQTIEVEIKDLENIQNAMSNILNKFSSFVLDPLRAKFVLTVENSES